MAIALMLPLGVAAGKGCLTCHEGIEAFSSGPMMEAIEAKARVYGDPGGCVVCHGGTPSATSKDAAHRGAPKGLAEGGGPQGFYPDPGSLWINRYTCGQCHRGYAERLAKSLMNTEAGKLQGNFWSWGLQKDRKVVWGNGDIKDEDGPVPVVGTKAYKAYMTALIASHPDQFPAELRQVPEVDVDEIPKHPNKAAITYARQECQRCHVGVTGRERRGDYRGSGCSACHVPYSNEGLYEGGDPTIDKTEPGHVLVHRMQATRKSKVTVGGVTYSGIPVETCNTCHNRGKRIGVSYQGLMEFPYGSPYDARGKKQPPLHTKRYLFIKDDLHHQQQSRPGNPKGGLLCQDCHTSIDMHGDGNIFGTTLAQVEIECADCHGTPDKYPWELPLGYGEEFGKPLDGKPRGVARELPPFMAFATRYDPEDGYLLTARGNPFGNVVRRKDKVILHGASGLDFQVPLLKNLYKGHGWRSLAGAVAMVKVKRHMESMECYACHADWVPQCYGCHVTVDYSQGKMRVDWIRNAHTVQPNGLTPDAELGTDGLKSPGKVSETRSYLRWEEPTLGINGEGRVSPMMPGCQVIATVIDKEGHAVAHNVIWNTPEGPGLDHAAVQPHTAGRQARTCESCHDNPKALGYGIEGGRFVTRLGAPLVVDLETADGRIIPGKAKVQSPGIPGLAWDLSQIVTRSGRQLVSVGSHWELTGPLTQAQREKMERTGLCLGCHGADDALWSKVATPGWLNDKAHQDLMNRALRALAGEGSP